MKKEKIFPQNQDKLGMRAEASEACMRGDAIHKRMAKEVGVPEPSVCVAMRTMRNVPRGISMRTTQLRIRT